MCKEGKALPNSNKCRRNDETGKLPFGNLHSNNCFRQEITGWKFDEKGDMIQSHCNSTQDNVKNLQRKKKTVDTTLLRVQG